ncbi:MAG: urease accessory protein [Leifsonia xyli]|nr:MAG: urease accessory protein [Leifsonia xyli]
MRKLLTALAATVFLLPQAALAHTGVGDTNGFAHGFMHPIGGVDHVLAMVAVGILAAQLGGRAIWLVPAAFVGMMVVGGAIGMSGVDIPLVEVGIALSVVVLGLAVALGMNIPLVAAMALVGFFAIFHGHAHGAEMPETASCLGYGVGFVIATALLHAAGVGIGLAIGRIDSASAPRVTQVAGGAMTIAGVAMISGII